MPMSLSFKFPGCRRRARRAFFRTACHGARVVAVALLLASLWLCPTVAHGDESTAPQAPDELTPAEIQQQLDGLQTAVGLDDAAKAALVDSYQKALSFVKQAAAFKAQAEEYARHRQEAPAELEEVRNKLANPPIPPPISPDTSLAKLEQMLLDKKAALAAEEKAVAGRDAETENRAKRRLAAPKAAVDATVRIDELDHLLATPNSDPDQERQIAARRILMLAERQRVAAELAAIKQELLSYEATDELLPLQRDEAYQQASRTSTEIKQLQELVNTRRVREAEASAAQAQAALRESATSHPFVRAIAEDNAHIAEQRTKLIAEYQNLWRDVENDITRLQHLTKDLARMQQRAELRGLENIGVLLRKQGATLPDPRQLRRKAASLRTEMAEAELALFEAQDQRTTLSDIEKLVANTLVKLDIGITLAERDNVELALRDHLERKRENLDFLVKSYKDLAIALDALASVRDALADKSEEYHAFVAERVLWVRSANLLGMATITSTVSTISSFAQSINWPAIGKLLADDFGRQPLAYLVLLLLVSVAVPLRSRLRRKLREVGKIAARNSTDSFKPTAQAVFFTAALAAIGPGLLTLIAWRLLAVSNEWLPEMVATGLLATALVYLPAETLRQVCRPQGLGEAHFHWPARGLGVMRRSMLRLMIVGLPLVFLIAAVNSQDNDGWKDSLGRLAFLAVMSLVAIFLWRVLRPVGGILHEAMALQPGAWLDRFRLVWYPLAVGAPVALAALMASGFCYTAIQLAWRMQSTLGLILLLILLHSLARRWLLVARRRLAMEQARQRRAALSESKEAANAGGELPAVELVQADLSVVNVQTRKLLQSVVTLALGAGLYLIWVDVLPALGILNQRELWSVESIETLIDAKGAAQQKLHRSPVTWGNGALALVAAVMTVLATRNIPGLLEITILQRLPLEPAGRYAITTISRYLIIIAGVVFTCGQLGLGWSRVQWLAAAVTVGLGFGLQEIFANFVSGLIILFERPIRVGDTITVAGMTGNVSRIRIRATTITDGDRKELIVPNREFITGQVLNWTLSDQVVRLVIPVGVGYDSDTEQVKRLILDVARRHPGLLKEPAPTAFFEGFGDSTLNFMLRVFVPNLEHLGEIRHSLHSEINAALRKANIEIAFPQRDVHIRSIGPLSSVLDAMPTSKQTASVPANHFAQRKSAG